MKFFNISLSLLIGLAAVPAFALTPFTTIDQARQNCPAIVALNYTAINQYQGTISGDGKIFHSANTMRPKNINPSDQTGLVTGAQFRLANGMYGYISGNNTVCLYSYVNYKDTSVALILQTAKIH